MMNRVVATFLVRRMWILAALAAMALLPCDEARAQVRVNGYRRSNGTYVQGHYRSKPNGNFYDNWSTKGNRNPYTGEWGTRVTPPDGYGGVLGGGVPNSFHLPGNTALESSSYQSALPGWGPGAIQEAPAAAFAEAEDNSSPRGIRPATLQESIETGAVDGQVVENPFVKNPLKKNSNRQPKAAR